MFDCCKPAHLQALPIRAASISTPVAEAQLKWVATASVTRPCGVQSRGGQAGDRLLALRVDRAVALKERQVVRRGGKSERAAHVQAFSMVAHYLKQRTHASLLPTPNPQRLQAASASNPSTSAPRGSPRPGGGAPQTTQAAGGTPSTPALLHPVGSFTPHPSSVAPRWEFHPAPQRWHPANHSGCRRQPQHTRTSLQPTSRRWRPSNHSGCRRHRRGSSSNVAVCLQREGAAAGATHFPC